MPNSRFALHGKRPSLILTVCAPNLPLIHGICGFFRPHLDTCLGSPFFASRSVHGLHFTVYAALKRHKHKELGEAFLLTDGAFLLTVKLLRIQSLKDLIRRTFQL